MACECRTRIRLSPVTHAQSHSYFKISSLPDDGHTKADNDNFGYDFVGDIHFIWKVYIFALFCANFAELFHYERCDVSVTKMEMKKDEIAPLMWGQECIGTKDEIVP